MSILKLMENRYSCRRYSDKEVSEEDILKILEAGRVAPTSHNIQPQRIYVVRTEEGKKKLLKGMLYNFKAPYFIVCGYNSDEVYKNPLNNFKESGGVDVSIVMTHMMLMIEELGLGACWIGHINPEAIRKSMELPENIKIVGVFNLGHHREDDRPSKLHFRNRENREIVEFL